MKIELYTRSGELAAVAQIPEFPEPPDIIVWGERIFCNDNFVVDTADDDALIYSEALVHVIPDGK